MARATLVALCLCVACASRSVTHDSLAGEVQIAVETLNDPSAPESARARAAKVLTDAPAKIIALGKELEKEKARAKRAETHLMYAALAGAALVTLFVVFAARR